VDKEKIVQQFEDLRKTLRDLFDLHGWTVERCEIVEKLGRVLRELNF
jgi:hypothetical protein